ncbi:bifunctional NADP phosphatase/NAD kinase [Methanobrevibacter sp.]|uniref:bifunctional NADP phosphatase/NAD kinase n=1 Tax=Methanobrevibacter sp. TaxID=66852 RepID=UPI003867219D
MDAQDRKMATDLAYEIIKEVSRAIRPYIGTPEAGEKVKIGADGTPTSLIDVVSEEIVVHTLKEAPVYSYIISEEIGELRLGKGTKRAITLTQELRRDDLSEEEKPRFIFLVDPIDGTSNAIKEIPAFAISIAVASVPDGRVATLNDVELAFISNLANGNFFEAEKGKGCWLNNKEVHPSDVVSFSNLTLGGFTKSGTSQASKLVDNARRMRVMGSVVLELSYVASGRYDAFLDLRGSRIIDIAAAKLILEEAGGIITDKYGEKLNNTLSIYEKTIVVAANTKILHKEMIDILNDNETDIIGKVGIVGRIDQDRSILFSAEIIDYLLTNGREVQIEERLAKKIIGLKENPKLDEIIKKTKETYPEMSGYLENIDFNIDYEKLSRNTFDFDCDMAIILGGDGTLLRAEAKMKPEIPVFGINMGTVGFLTDTEIQDTFTALDEILRGEYYKEKRSRLVVSHENNYYSAINEVVIMTNKPAKMLHFQIKVDGEIIDEVRADGLIVSTPSGSTAYAMSAGGPIMDPKVGGFIIIPICPYKLGARPFVVSDNSEITVKLLKKGKSAVFVMDGQRNEEADYEEEIKFKKSDKDVYFIRTSTKYFYKKVKDKLAEGGVNDSNRCINE